MMTGEAARIPASYPRPAAGHSPTSSSTAAGAPHRVPTVSPGEDDRPSRWAARARSDGRKYPKGGRYRYPSHPWAAEALLAATRRLQEAALRRVAAGEHDLVDPAMPGFLGYVAGHTDAALEEGYVPTAEEMAVAALVEAEVARMAESMARMAGRLRRGADAAGLAAGDEALAAALRRQAANADDARAMVEAFAASVRRFLAAGSSSRRPASEGSSDNEAFLNAYLILVVAIVP